MLDGTAQVTISICKAQTGGTSLDKKVHPKTLTAIIIW